MKRVMAGRLDEVLVRTLSPPPLHRRRRKIHNIQSRKFPSNGNYMGGKKEKIPQNTRHLGYSGVQRRKRGEAHAGRWERGEAFLSSIHHAKGPKQNEATTAG